jgi:hypothetical protein
MELRVILLLGGANNSELEARQIPYMYDSADRRRRYASLRITAGLRMSVNSWYYQNKEDHITIVHAQRYR